jgi:Tfp pilus assembly protein PilO
MEFEDLPWYGQFFITLGLMLIILALFYFFFYKGKSAEIDSMKTEIASIDREINRARKKIDELKNIEKGIQEKEAQLRELMKILPEQKEISEILKKIQSIISTTRLKMDKQAGQKEKMVKNVLMKKSLKIKVTGNYHNLAFFFDQLSELDKIFTVDNLIITPVKSKVNSQVHTIEAEFIASSYYLISQDDKVVTDTKKGKKKKGVKK